MSLLMESLATMTVLNSEILAQTHFKEDGPNEKERKLDLLFLANAFDFHSLPYRLFLLSSLLSVQQDRFCTCYATIFQYHRWFPNYWSFRLALIAASGVFSLQLIWLRLSTTVHNLIRDCSTDEWTTTTSDVGFSLWTINSFGIRQSVLLQGLCLVVLADVWQLLVLCYACKQKTLGQWIFFDFVRPAHKITSCPSWRAFCFRIRVFFHLQHSVFVVELISLFIWQIDSVHLWDPPFHKTLILTCKSNSSMLGKFALFFEAKNRRGHTVEGAVRRKII